MRKTKSKENLYPIEGKLYLTKNQKIMLNKTFGCVRFVRNKRTYDFLHPVYTETDETVILKNGKEGKKRIYEKSLTLGQMKKLPKFAFLKEVDSLALSNTNLNFIETKEKFLKQDKPELTERAIKKLKKDPNYITTKEDYKGCPRFIRKQYVQSYTTNNQHVPYVKKDGTECITETVVLVMDRKHPNKGRIKLPKIGWLKVTLNRPIKNAEICSVTVARLKSGIYKISILTQNSEVVETAKKILKQTTNETGIDLGVKSYIKDSNNQVVEPPKFYRKAEKRLKKAQRTLSRRFTKGEKSKNYEKQCKKVAKLHEKVRNQRKDFLQKLSNKYISENQTIYIYRKSKCTVYDEKS